VAARVRIPLGLPMKKLALVTMLLFIVSCGGSDASTDESAATQSIEAPRVAGLIAKVVCEPLSSLTQKSPSEIKESWQCKRKGKQIDFDIYISQAAKQLASDDALSLLGTTGSSQTWDDTPILCGAEWTMGVADIKTRDELITELNTAGVSASTC
jgi:hypothetical protein